MILILSAAVLLFLAWAIRRDHYPVERAVDTMSWLDWIETAGLA